MQFKTKSILVLLFIYACLINPLSAAQLLGLQPVPIPADNPLSPAKIKLGKRLFFDKRFSEDGTISCASCHLPQKAFTDGLPQAKGIRGLIGQRNTPTIINAAFYTRLFLDGRADSLETQALGPLLNPIEHGVKDPQMLINIIIKDRYYRQQFSKAFHITVRQINQTHLAQALASYERTIISADTGFDRYLYGEQEDALSESAKRGLRLFKRKGNCSNCHEIGLNHALFSDNNYYNIGVGYNKLAPKMLSFISTLKANQDNPAKAIALFNSSEQSELGRFAVTTNSRDIGRFRTPSLRNVALTAPYMHDGSQATLEDVVEYYDKGGNPNVFLDPAIFPLKLTSQEKADLVVFMQSLTSN